MLMLDHEWRGQVFRREARLKAVRHADEICRNFPPPKCEEGTSLGEWAEAHEKWRKEHDLLDKAPPPVVRRKRPKTQEALSFDADAVADDLGRWYDDDDKKSKGNDDPADWWK